MRISSQRTSERAIGGKAWNLIRLVRCGFPVPRFFVLPSSLFDRLLAGRKEEVNTILRDIDDSDRSSLEQCSRQIQEIISGADIPDGLQQRLIEKIDRLFGPGALFSVRSSVAGEDSAEHSFAGQMDSFLNVGREGLMAAVKKVWASAYSSRSLVYRRETKVAGKEISGAVIIQEMVQAASSGIIFTRDPGNRAAVCLISAGYGLGEGIVANRVESDTYRIGWHGRRIFKEIKTKDFRVTLDAESGCGCRLEPVPQGMGRRPVLADRQVRRLRDLGVKAEKRFSRPLDIEWAFDSRGKLYLLQARPIVFAGRQRLSESLRVWDNSNILESYPGLTLPLTFSFVRAAYETAFRKAMQGLFRFNKEARRRQDIYSRMIGLLGGRVYYNLLNWYEMLSFLPGFEKHKVSWDQMIGISRRVDFPRRRISPFSKLLTSLIVLGKLLVPGRRGKKFFRHFCRAYGKFRDLDFAAPNEEDLISIYHELEREFTTKWHLTLYNDFCAMKYFDWLQQVAARWGLEDGQAINPHSLLCGLEGIESVEVVRSIVASAELVQANPVYRELFKTEDNKRIWTEINRGEEYSALRAAVESHLGNYGDRGIEELKLENPTFRENPAALIELIKKYACLGLSVRAMVSKENKIRGEAEALIRGHLKNPLQRLLFNFVLRNARKSVINRENMRFARTRLFGIVRRLFRRMGELLADKAVLEKASDIYYLTVEEVFGLVQGTAVTIDLRPLVGIRKEEYGEFAKRTLLDRFETQGIPSLNCWDKERVSSPRGKMLRGIKCSAGQAEGRAKVIRDPRCPAGEGDYILVAQSTDPGWVFLMIASKGIVVERGSVLSHTAIIGRELGIPTVVGARGATHLIPDGARTFINADTGEVRWL